MALLGFAASALSQVHPGIDVAELVRQHQAAARAAPPPKALVLVTFGMPPASLRRLVSDSARVGVPLVLRGLVDGSMARTLAQVREIDPALRAKWQVDPRVFRAIDAQAAPVFAVWRADGWQTVRGDVSLGYALRLLATGGNANGLAARLADLLGH